MVAGCRAQAFPDGAVPPWQLSCLMGRKLQRCGLSKVHSLHSPAGRPWLCLQSLMPKAGCLTLMERGVKTTKSQLGWDLVFSAGFIMNSLSFLKRLLLY